MTSDRPYADRRDAAALNELDLAATQNNPQVLAALRQAVRQPARA
jgi:hypothetical protein